MALSLIMTSIFSALPYLVRNAAGSVIAGIFVVIAFIALLLLAIRAFYPRSTFSSASIFTAAVLAVLLSLQFVPMCACIAMKWRVDDFREWLDDSIVHPQLYEVPRAILPEESTQIVERATREYPVLGLLFCSGKFTGYDTSNIAGVIADELDSELNRMIGWMLVISLAETALGAFIIIRMLDARASRRSRERATRLTGRAGAGSRSRRGRPGVSSRTVRR